MLPGTCDGGGSGMEKTVPRSRHGPTGFGLHHAFTVEPKMLNGFVINRNPVP